ncbi:MAG: ubiquinone/menaquinone biosynthesis methyltransferase [Terrimicrobiaceae bacterium]
MRETFAGISTRYDVANHILSGGVDFFWRAKAARLVAEAHPARILDLATGSGDLAMALKKANPRAQVVGVDFCLPMLEIAQKKGMTSLIQGDGLALPFQDATFDALTVAFGLRNMASWDRALKEMARVLQPGGLLLVMDFSMPTNPLLLPLYRLYLHHGLPRIAGLLTGRPEAYDYLGESIEKFPRGETMLRLVEGCGFESLRAFPLAFGVAAITVAKRKP